MEWNQRNRNKVWIQGFCLVVLGFLLTQCTTIKHPVQGVSRSNRPYYVQKSWHYPQAYYDYDKTGLASWYGPRFHGLKTAQGGIYDQYAMTAAHKTLPLPTIVKVTNLVNQKSVVVLLNDRGPFKYKNRIIDLSVAAAREIGLYNQGVGKVRVQSLPKESHAFSIYLKQYAGKHGFDRKNRLWEQVYREEIGSKLGYQNLSVISPKFCEPQKKVEKLKDKSNRKKPCPDIRSIIERCNIR